MEYILKLNVVLLLNVHKNHIYIYIYLLFYLFKKMKNEIE